MAPAATDIMAQKAIAHYRQNRAQYLDILKTLVRIPSISFSDYDSSHLRVAAQAISNHFAEQGLGALTVLDTSGGPPCLFGNIVGENQENSVLLYSHYDVQPPLCLELWKSPPFEPVERDGRLFGRGTGDDKAGIVAHLAALASYMRTAGHLPLNVKLLLEGEEEVGSPHLNDTITRHLHLLESDAVVILDGSNFAAGLPTITTSMRGLVTVSVSVTAGEHALHSGLWGGPIPDPAAGLAKMLAGLHDENGRIAIDGLREGGAKPTERELSDIRALKMATEVFREQTKMRSGVRIFGEGDEILRRLWHEPSIAVNSMIAGDRKTAGNVVLNSAWARIGIRLTAGMDPALAIESLARHFRKKCPWGLEIDIKPESNTSPAWKANVEHPAYAIARKALSEGYGRPAVFAGVGATVPLVAMMANKTPGAAPIMVGVLDPESNPHAENESLLIEDFHRAVESEILFLAEMSGATLEHDPSTPKPA